MNWIKSLFKSTIKVGSVSKFDVKKSSVLILPSPEIDIQKSNEFDLDIISISESYVIGKYFLKLLLIRMSLERYVHLADLD